MCNCDPTRFLLLPDCHAPLWLIRESLPVAVTAQNDRVGYDEGVAVHLAFQFPDGIFQNPQAVESLKRSRAFQPSCWRHQYEIRSDVPVQVLPVALFDLPPESLLEPGTAGGVGYGTNRTFAVHCASLETQERPQQEHHRQLPKHAPILT